MPKSSSPIYNNTPRENGAGKVIFLLFATCLLGIAALLYFTYGKPAPAGQDPITGTLYTSLAQSNDIIDDTNRRILSTIQRRPKTEQSEKALATAREAKTITDELAAYIETLKSQLYSPGQQAGLPEDDSRANALLLGTKEAPGEGYQLKERFRETREQLASLMNLPAAVAASLPLNSEEDAGAGKDWVDYHFGDKPAPTAFTLLTKFQNDAKATATLALNYLLSAAEGEYYPIDAFEPAVSADRPTVGRGENYRAEIFLSPYSTVAGRHASVYVDGKPIPVENGKAVYQTTANTAGPHPFQVRIETINPTTGATESHEKEFQYEVSERAIQISPEKMNVFYIGVDNPLAISAAGISSNDLSVSISGGGGTIKGRGANYIVNVTTPGECRINVSGGSMRDSKFFRIKRIPDPVARLSKSSGGAMGNGEFKAQGGVGAFLDDFDFDARCAIQGFRLTYIASGEAPVEVVNAGARYNAESRKLVNMAQPGDIYLFDNVKARCPGDNAGRKVNSMAFRIR